MERRFFHWEIKEEGPQAGLNLALEGKVVRIC